MPTRTASAHCEPGNRAHHSSARTEKQWFRFSSDSVGAHPCCASRSILPVRALPTSVINQFIESGTRAFFTRKPIDRTIFPLAASTLVWLKHSDSCSTGRSHKQQNSFTERGLLNSFAEFIRGANSLRANLFDHETRFQANSSCGAARVY